jgi:hypothetical protein
VVGNFRLLVHRLSSDKTKAFLSSLPVVVLPRFGSVTRVTSRRHA